MPPTGMNQALRGGGGQVRCERRSEVFVIIQKKNIEGGQVGSGLGVRVDVNEELKFCENSIKKLGGGGGGGRVGGVGSGGSRGGGGRVGRGSG